MTMNLFDTAYDVYLMACKDTSPPFYLSAEMETFSTIIRELQNHANDAGEVTVDVFHTAEERQERFKDVVLEKNIDAFENLLPVPLDSNAKLSTLYINTPSYAESINRKIQLKFMIRIMYHYQHPSPSADFLVMWAVSSDFKTVLDTTFQDLYNAFIKVFSPLVVLQKHRPFAIKRGAGYSDALIDFTVSKILDSAGNVRDKFSDWSKIYPNHNL